MPAFLSNIPGLSSLPNPLNMFNNDDDQHAAQNRQTQNQAGNNMSNPSSPVTASITAAPAKITSILSRGLDAITQSSPSTPSRTMSQDSNDATPTARGAPPSSGSAFFESPPPARKGSASNVVIAEEPVDADSSRSERTDRRPRGSSSATAATAGSGLSGAVSDSRRRRKQETFVLVKPPPTSGKNPLNLQVQLVMPAKPTRPRRGSDATRVTTEDHSSGPSTPVRGSFEKPERVDTNASEASVPSSTTSTPEKDDSSVVAAAKPKPVRRGSVSSQQSATSNSTTSTSAAGNGKQRIIPLYNLAVHNVVQPTVVTDAGTDSKVAKFLKRNLDISGVGILEPSEIWLPFQAPAASPRPSFDCSAKARPPSMISNMSLLSPAVSRVDDNRRASMDVKSKIDNLLQSRGEEDGAKKFFGKIFRKRNSAEPLVDRRASRSTPSKSQAVGTETANLQVPASPAVPNVHFNGDAGQIGHPTFGLAPSVITRQSSETQLNANGAIVGLAAAMPRYEGCESEPLNISRSGRPIGYTWTVRRWAKKNTEGWAAHLVAAAASGLDLVAGQLPGDGEDEVTFEWVKMRLTPGTDAAAAALRRHPATEGLELPKPRPPRPTRSQTTPSPGGSPGGSRTSLLLRSRGRPSRQSSLVVDAEGSVQGNASAPPIQVTSPVEASEGSKRSDSPAEGASRSSDDTGSGKTRSDDDVAESTRSGAVGDDGYDSDPEDSETPWACSVWIKRTGERQLLATLTPAPHHPKVIGVLKIPYAIKSITLADVSPNAAAGKSAQAAVLAARVKDEVCLTEENIKDVVNVTAMWLVAREEFAGFGRKEKRKG